MSYAVIPRNFVLNFTKSLLDWNNIVNFNMTTSTKVADVAKPLEVEQLTELFHDIFPFVSSPILSVLLVP